MRMLRVPQNTNSILQAVRARYLQLSKTAPRPPPGAPAQAADDEEEYEPDFEPEDAEQIVNKLDGLSSTEMSYRPGPSAPLAPYKLPEAPPLTEQEVQKHGDMTVRRAFGMLSSIDEKEKSKISKTGFTRLAASDYGRDAWVTILSRVATRASAGLEDPDEGIKDEFAVKVSRGSTSVSDSVRDGLYHYIINDWKRRIDVAISWLNEEWYNDTVLSQTLGDTKTNGHGTLDFAKGNYHRCVLRLLDGILPYVEHTDKVLLRFLSEIPALDYAILSRVKKMAEDPERIDLACKVLQYLYMFRPPVRSVVLDVLTELWRDNDEAKPNARKLLQRWRPEVLEEDTVMGDGVVKAEVESGLAKESANGALEVKAAS